MFRVVLIIAGVLVGWMILSVIWPYVFAAQLIWLALAWRKYKQRQQLPLYRRIR